MADTPAQVALDERGLEAATAAYNDLMFGNDAAHAAQIVRAYLSSLSNEAGDDGQGALVERARLLDLSNLLKHAFISGRESVSGCGSLNAEAWVAYDPEQCPAYGRIRSALSDYAALRADRITELQAKVERLERERNYYKELLSASDADRISAESRLAEEGQTQGEAVDCDRCAGNGEIVTDWDRYRHPHDGDVGDEAVADCPDCFGVGTVAATPAPSLPEDVERVVERFEITHDPDIGMIHRPHPHGYYVRYSDYSDLQRQLAEARAEIERLTPLAVAYDYLESPAGREMAEADRARLAAENASRDRLIYHLVSWIENEAGAELPLDEDQFNLACSIRAALASLEDRG